MGGWIAHAGTTGTDHSVNAAAVPGGAPLLTIGVNPRRNAISVQNQSTATLTLVRDDGAGNQVTIFILSPAAVAGAQGSDWQSYTFKGRLRVFGAAGSQVSACED